ncbi:hypothetical protein JB92DRAFT_3037519, partial [Gautieria morchelliformis]
MTAIQRTVAKEGVNKGRVFWTCPNSEKARCGFFEWDDDQGSSGGGVRGSDSGQGGSQPTGECFKCGEAGHWSNACPNGSTSGKKRHTGLPNRAGSQPTDECFKCGEAGHWSNG